MQYLKKKMHAPWKTFPHISLPIQMLDPASAAPLTPSTDSEAKSLALLALARPVLRAFAAASTFPELLAKQETHRSLGNLGDYLVGNRDQPELGEAHRALLMDETVDEDSAIVLVTAGLSIERPKVTLHNKGVQRLLPAQVDAIEDAAKRLACVPIRSQPVAALMLNNGNRAAEVKNALCKQGGHHLAQEASQDDQLKLSMVITSMKQQRKIITARLPPSAHGIVDQLFSRARTVALAPGLIPETTLQRLWFLGMIPALRQRTTKCHFGLKSKWASFASRPCACTCCLRPRTASSPCGASVRKTARTHFKPSS